QAGADLGGLDLRRASHLLGDSLVAAPFPCDSLAVGVGIAVVPNLPALDDLLGHLTPPSSRAGAGSRPPTPGRSGPCPPCRGPCQASFAGTDRAVLDRCRSPWRWRNGSSPRTGSPLEFAR